VESGTTSWFGGVHLRLTSALYTYPLLACDGEPRMERLCWAHYGACVCVIVFLGLIYALGAYICSSRNAGAHEAIRWKRRMCTAIGLVYAGDLVFPTNCDVKRDCRTFVATVIADNEPAHVIENSMARLTLRRLFNNLWT
jgi:hypothetical protein